MPKARNVIGRLHARAGAWCACLLLGTIAGCISGPKLIIESPLSPDEQQQAILKLAPLGTSRNDVLLRLDREGILYSQGASNSTYYCSVWNRPNGERWHLNVSLLFDKSGRLYELRRKESDTGIADHEFVEPDTEPARSAGDRAYDSGDASREPVRGAGPRSPFSK